MDGNRYIIETMPDKVGHTPNQVEGTIGGKPFYFRARHKHWTLYIDGEIVCEGNSSTAGWWSAAYTLFFVDSLLRLLSEPITFEADEP